ncbi:TOBE domain-containing protein [Massilia sp. TS11]|uniref:TOBE domain-containing protein n=1 Tax=Massilia sp. TS11 TaxID=2908003 RepID=UPI001EDB8B43|nr:TOBE domain-containing protein [Massilia sp. TS11]MCG2586022.1 TOBE domain-containing protein [Massilia sp. TS11]
MKSPAFSVEGALWMRIGSEKFGGKGRIDLLAKLAECGSITQAAKAVGISYKAAWDAIDAMNNLAGAPLVERAKGGRGGGGTRLTARGQQLVANFQTLEAAHQRFVRELSEQAGSLADDYLLIRRMAMKTSARNQFFGRVSAIRRGAVNDEITLCIVGGQSLVATITHESTQSLGLAVGSEAFALVKASSIMLADTAGGTRFSARNQLQGTISRLQTGAVNTEVNIDLGEGGSLAAIVTNESAAAMQLAPGAPVCALFKASSLILGVPA